MGQFQWHKKVCLSCEGRGFIPVKLEHGTDNRECVDCIGYGYVSKMYKEIVTYEPVTEIDRLEDLQFMLEGRDNDI